jgi:hypothetical protein
MIDVDAGDIERSRRLPMVGFRLDAIGPFAPAQRKVLRHELAWSGMGAHELGLPRQEVGYEAALVCGKSVGHAGVDRAVGRREIVPTVDPVRPVI